MTPRKYEGKRADGFVRVLADGKLLHPGPSQRIENHSPTGFEWGYAGSGPAQLALAILLDYFQFTQTEEPKRKAQMLHQDFKFAFVCQFPKAGWTLTGDQIDGWLQAVSAAREAEASA
jgi:hypothetical protein